MCHSFKRDVWFYYLTHISFISVQKICKSTFKSIKPHLCFTDSMINSQKKEKKEKKKLEKMTPNISRLLYDNRN
jgi:hypothetical protein